MLFSLSRSARVLLIHAIFAVFALGSLLAVWDNRVFLHLFPFYLLAFADVLFAAVFLYLALPERVRVRLGILQQFDVKRAYVPLLIVYGIFIVVRNLLSSWLFVHALGLERTAREAGLSVSHYIAQEILYLGILPALAVVVLIWIIRRKILA